MPNDQTQPKQSHSNIAEPLQVSVLLHIMSQRSPSYIIQRQESLNDKQQTRSLDKPLHSTRSSKIAVFLQSWRGRRDAHHQTKQYTPGCNSPTKIRRGRATLSAMRLDTDHCKVVTDNGTIESLTNTHRPQFLRSLGQRRVKHRVHATASPPLTPPQVLRTDRVHPTW